MAAPTEVYVNPAIAGNSGTGTIGDPYGDLQYALNQKARDAVGGDRFNVKAGTDEVLGAALDFSTYGTPTTTAPWICQGYTSAAGDGGIGGISGNGSYAVINSATLDAIHFVDMHLHNVGSAAIITLDDYCSFINCEVDNTTGSGIVADIHTKVLNCYIHNIDANGVQLGEASLAAYCTFENGTNDFVFACNLGNGSVCAFNVFDLNSSSHGFRSGDYRIVVMYNSIYSNAGTGAGIEHSGGFGHIIIGNIVEGFSGVGGIGIEIAAGADVQLMGYNAFYNNTTNESISGDVWVDLGNDQALGASPFNNASNDDFTVKTSVKALGYPTANYQSLSVRSYLDIGALQREEAGGGAGRTGGLFLGHTKL